MKFNIKRQQVFPSLVTLLVMCVAGAFALNGDKHIAYEFVSNESILGGYISDFQRSNPTWAIVLTAIIIYLSSSWLGRTISVQNLYSSSISLQLPIGGAISWCVALCGESLLCATILAVSTMATIAFFMILRNRDNLDNYLNASMALSILPLLYSPSIILWLALPVILISIDVTLRCWIVSTVGLLLLPATTFYIFWLGGADFLTAPRELLSQYITLSGLLNFHTVLLFRTAMITLATLLSLLSTLWIKDNIHRTRTRLQISTILLIASLLTLAAPSTTLLSFCILAPSLTTLATLALSRIRDGVTSVLYIIFMVLLLLSMFIPLYLPL